MQIINENGTIYLKGLLTEADRKNGNGRIYPKSILKPAVLDLAERVAKEPQSIYTERDHPPRDTIPRHLACGLITEVKWNDMQNHATCRVKVLDDTEPGKKLLQDIKEGKRVGISTRGRGSLDENNIVTEIYFITADIVDVPSCQSCYLSESTGERITNDFIIGLDKKQTVTLEDHLKEVALIEAFRVGLS